MIRLSVIITALSLFSVYVESQKSSDSNGGNPSIYRGSDQYTYHGCYNETTQIQDSAEERALTGGSHLVKIGKMTVPLCLEFCASNGTQYKYAGLEWSRECWCSPYLSSLSQKLDDDECENLCEGNSSQVCGGPLKLSVYELSQGDTSDTAALTKIPLIVVTVSVIGSIILAI